MSISAILVAGGVGTRMKATTPKQFLLLKTKPIALYSFETLGACPRIREIIVVCDPQYRFLFPVSPAVKFAIPGTRRQDSVYNGVQLLSPDCEYVCIHDSARPFLTATDLENILDAAIAHGAATLAIPAKNTIKEEDGSGFIHRTLDRSKLWEMFTPQVAKVSLLKQGFAIAQANQLDVTDDNALIELIPHPVRLVRGSASNIKITVPEDWQIAETLVSFHD